MEKTKCIKKEYGGFLPLELNPGREYFAEYEDALSRFNSVKAAMDFLIGKLGGMRIFVPYYYCPSTIEAIRGTGLTVCFYHIGSNLMPVSLPDKSGDVVLLVDYFGVCTDRVVEFAHNFRNAEIIIDRAHSFYSKPIIEEHIHNVYSAKKFFGVPDGAYLISKAALSYAEVPSSAHDYAAYLFAAYEEGTNFAYRMKKDVDKKLAADYASMSKLAIGLLENVDYDRVEKQRIENYNVLYKAFRDVNELILPESCTAYQFPLLISNRGKYIKKRLIENKIFVSTLWSGRDLQEQGNAFELNLMENAVFLPMDQRYDRADMKFIINTIKEMQIE